MEESTRPTIVSVASSLLADLRHLVAQKLQLAKHEMQHELSKLVKAAIQAGVALGLASSVIKVGSSVRLWPFRTLHTLKEDAQWIKAHVFSAKT